MSPLLEPKRVKAEGRSALGGVARFAVVKQRMEAEQQPLLWTPPPRKLTLSDVVRYAAPRRDASPYAEVREEVNRFRRANFLSVLAGARRVLMAQALGLPCFYGRLSLAVIRGDGRVLPLGLAGLRVVTTAGVNFIVDAFQNSVEVENLKYHGLGTGSTAEAVGDNALVTELTTEYNPDSTRATGSLTEGASANIFRTVGTNTLDGTPGAALREHGIFSAASAGTLLDRTVFAAITLSSGDGLQSTYDLTVSAGG
jgi:hypothetical protein